MSRVMIDTGVPWIGYLPKEWSIQQVKQAFEFKKSKAKQENPIILSLARDSVKVRDISNNEGQLAESYVDYNPVEVGDLLINPMDLYSGANCNVSKVSGVISPAYFNLRAREGINPFYYDYYFKIQYWHMAMFAHGKGVSFEHRWTLNRNDALKYWIPKLPIADQNAIVNAINHKSEKIDHLIKIQEQQIEKLKEYKQSIISKTVAKGMDDNVAMKDSGIEWIGKVPKEWKIGRVKNFYNVFTGATPSSDNPIFWGGEIAWVTPSDFKTEDTYVGFGKRNLTIQGLNACSANLLPEGSIILSKRAPIGTVAISSRELTTNQGCVGLVSKSNMYNNKYLYYYLSSISSILNVFGSGTTFLEISVQNIKALNIIVPSLETQKLIVSFLDKEVSKIDYTLGQRVIKIEKLQEYKKSIIYEYVTGKKEAAKL